MTRERIKKSLDPKMQEIFDSIREGEEYCEGLSPHILKAFVEERRLDLNLKTRRSFAQALRSCSYAGVMTTFNKGKGYAGKKVLWALAGALCSVEYQGKRKFVPWLTEELFSRAYRTTLSDMMWLSTYGYIPGDRVYMNLDRIAFVQPKDRLELLKDKPSTGDIAKRYIAAARQGIVFNFIQDPENNQLFEAQEKLRSLESVVKNQDWKNNIHFVMKRGYQGCILVRRDGDLYGVSPAIIKVNEEYIAYQFIPLQKWHIEPMWSILHNVDNLIFNRARLSGFVKSEDYKGFKYLPWK